MQTTIDNLKAKSTPAKGTPVTLAAMGGNTNTPTATNISMPQNTTVPGYILVPSAPAINFVTPDPLPKAVTKPPQFKVGGNIDVFIDRLENYFWLHDATNEEKIAILNANVDETTFRIILQLQVSATERRSFPLYHEVVRRRFAPVETEQELQLRFKALRQRTDQNLDEYYELLLVATQKAFLRQPGDVVDEHLRDQFIARVSDKDIRIRMIENAPADSRIALNLAKRLQAACTFTARIDETPPKPATAISVNSITSTGHRGRGKGRGRDRGPSQYKSRPFASRTEEGKPVCFTCGRAGHFASRCRQNWQSRRKYHATTPQ